MSSSAGPSRVSRPRRSSASTSNGSAASSTGTGDGARMGASAENFVSGDCEDMALYLGSGGGIRKGVFRVPDAAQRATLLRRAGTHLAVVAWAPDQQRITPQVGRAAQHPGNAKP